jgi:sucrose-6-phosphate hydrolase SacC (GH32 family)
MFERLYQHQWMTIPRDVRIELVKIFNIPVSAPTEVRNQEVITDGVTNGDLEVVTKEKLAEYTNKKEGTFAELFELAVKQVTNILQKEADQKLELHKAMLNGSVTVMPQVPEVKKYCDTCTSTKGRHKKGCPKFK